MSSDFIVKKVSNIRDFKEGDKIPESDFSLFTQDDKFVQFTYLEEDEEKNRQYPVKPGIFTITTENQVMVLKESSFTQQPILEESISTKEISSKINTFFSRINIYEKYGMDPKRAMLLYGKHGCGKSVTIGKVCSEYAANKDTTVVIWPSDKFAPKHVKDLIKNFDYTKHNIAKLILVIEDLGGVEDQDGPRQYSQSSLLSLLDNVEKTFKIPTMILATTNFPEKFLENLTDRPQRFDDVMEVKRPSPEFRAKFLEFFSQGEATDSAKKQITDKKYDNFSVAHVKEVVIRAALYDITHEEAIEQLYVQSNRSIKGFTNRKGMGLNSE